MKRNQDTELLRSQTLEIGRRGRFCPESHQLAEFFTGSLEEDKRIQIERHVSDCGHCLAQLGMLERVAGNDDPAQVPETLLASAKGLGRQKPEAGARGISRRTKLSLAAAAILAGLLIVPRFVVDRPGDPGSVPYELPDQPRQYRGPEVAGTGTLTITGPGEGAVISNDIVEIRWTPVPGALFYELQVMSEGGDILHDERVDGTKWSWNTGRELVPGHDYYLRVVAHLDDGRELKSGHTRVQAESER